MEKISYEEAREWFWIRTAVWLIPAFIVSAIGFFAYAGTVIDALKPRIEVALLSALGATLLGMVAASISKGLPWMRLGRWKLWWLNAFVCAGSAAFGAIALSLVTLAALRSNPEVLPGSSIFDTASSIMEIGTCVAAFWGAAFGTWFALRRDKYFVESI